MQRGDGNISLIDRMKVGPLVRDPLHAAAADPEVLLAAGVHRAGERVRVYPSAEASDADATHVARIDGGEVYVEEGLSRKVAAQHQLLDEPGKQGLEGW